MSASGPLGPLVIHSINLSLVIGIIHVGVIIVLRTPVPFIS